uniref:C3H1-type domain-containing protein n=1 Tax=Eutreptiella gymnastica TaxID=73025 RepID=A0A7S4CN19_9EUGL
MPPQPPPPPAHLQPQGLIRVGGPPVLPPGGPAVLPHGGPVIPNLPGHVLGNLPRMPLPTANPGVLGTAPGVPGPGMLPMGVQQLPPGQPDQQLVHLQQINQPGILDQQMAHLAQINQQAEIDQQMKHLQQINAPPAPTPAADAPAPAPEIKGPLPLPASVAEAFCRQIAAAMGFAPPEGLKLLQEVPPMIATMPHVFVDANTDLPLPPLPPLGLDHVVEEEGGDADAEEDGERPAKRRRVYDKLPQLVAPTPEQPDQNEYIKFYTDLYTVAGAKYCETLLEEESKDEQRPARKVPEMKVRMCRNFEVFKVCAWGDGCQYAHDRADLAFAH